MRTLWGNRVDLSIERLKLFEPPEGYHLAFSGGKDSVALLRLARMAGVKFDAHYALTTIDPPELVQFIRRAYPEVIIEHPPQTMWELVLDSRHLWPPMRQQRWCCEALKERLGHGELVLTGVRAEESPRRRARPMVEICMNDPDKRYLHPIIDWQEREVWEFIRQEAIPYCSLYDEGWKRLGCVLCPMARSKLRIAQAQRWPKLAAQWARTFDKLIPLRREAGRRCWFNTGQELFDWWINEPPAAKDPNQTSMFA